VVAAARARDRRGEQQTGSTGDETGAKSHRLPKDYEPFMPPAKNSVGFLHAPPLSAPADLGREPPLLFRLVDRDAIAAAFFDL
jgi:hypothetical protein